MKKLFFSKGQVKLEEVEMPGTFEEWVLVKTAYSFLSSGTERQTLSNQAKNLLQRFTENFSENATRLAESIKNQGLLSTIYQIKAVAYKAIECGYSCAGQVVWAGKDSGFRVGDFVACAGAGFACHAEFVAVPKNLTVKLTGSKSLKQASCTAIAAVALQGFRQTECRLGETVIIFGLGLVGLLALQIAKIAGCKVVGVDTQPERLDLATTFGCDRTILFADPGLETTINFFTAGQGADAVLVCAGGSAGLLDAGLNLLRRRGKVVALGDCSLQFERNNFYYKEASIVASCSYGPGRYHDEFERGGLDYPIEFVRWTETRNLELCAQMIERENLKISPLITAEVAFEEAQCAFTQIKNPETLGVVLAHDSLRKQVEPFVPSNLSVDLDPEVTARFRSVKRKLNVALVGVGGFAKTRLMPEIIASGEAKIYCLVDSSSANLINVGQQFEVSKKYTKMAMALADPEVDVVVISTPHGTHTALSIQALEAGKAVFVEKPPAVNLEQIVQLQEFLNAHPQAFYAADFNRSNSPYFDKIHKAVQQRACPLIIDYRVNAGFLAPTHWIYKAENNGRIIGEACHMVEFILALTGSEIASLCVSTIIQTKELARDNFTASMSFKDGSQATLLYTSLGNVAQEKERIEIFWEGRSLVLCDFEKLQGYGMPFGFDKTSFGPEKGHKQMFTKFFSCLKSGDVGALRALSNRALQATWTCVLIQELVDAGGGFLDLETGQGNAPTSKTLSA
jgi:predicted dehydrogenase/threonine dehydrogenase-like Zn-dependent dehydrogenase